MEKENKMMLLFVIFSVLLHITLYIYMPNILKNFEKKEEEEKITVKLIEYKKPQFQSKQVKEIKKSPEEKKVVSENKGKSPVISEKPKLIPKGETIIHNEKLPKIEIPKLDMKVSTQEKIVLDKPDQKNLTILRKDVNNKFEGENIELLESEEKVNISTKELFVPEIKDNFKEDNFEVQIKTGIDEVGKSIGEIKVPQEIELELVEGKGDVNWDNRNKLPKYPPEAEKRGWQGNVVLLMRVGQDGDVMYSKIEKRSGYDILDIEAERASKFWKINIINNNGVRIEGEVRLTLKFELKR